MKHRIIRPARTQHERDARCEHEAALIERVTSRIARDFARLHAEGVTNFAADVVCPVVETEGNCQAQESADRDGTEVSR